jgi:hypothetical protein
MKLIQSFAGEETTLLKYDQIAEKTKNYGTKAVKFQGIMTGIFFFFFFSFGPFAYSIGSELMRKRQFNIST